MLDRGAELENDAGRFGTGPDSDTIDGGGGGEARAEQQRDTEPDLQPSHQFHPEAPRPCRRLMFTISTPLFNDFVIEK
jgi:hypothetical protein